MSQAARREAWEAELEGKRQGIQASAAGVDVGALRAAVAELTAELDESRRREDEAKTQLSALKDTYLKVSHA